MRCGIRALSLFALVAVAGLVAAPSFGATGFGNGGFEDGSFSGWNQAGGYWYGYQHPLVAGADPAYPSDYTFTSDPSHSAIVTPGDIPLLASYGVHINQVFKGSYGARINDNDGGNFHFSEISQSVTNWTSQYLYFAWNAVLEEPGHGHSEEPHFFVQLDDLTSGQNVYKLFYASDNLPSAIFKQAGSYKYTDWQQVQLDTAKLYGHDLKLTILAADCGAGAHDGSLYVDDISASRVITANLPPVAVPTATPNHGDAGDAVALDGSASYDPESDPLDAYEWDVTGDFIADFSTMNATFNIPLSWAAGSSHNVYLRVHETPNNALPQWSDWTAAVIRVNGGDPGPSTPLPLAAWSGLSLLGGMGLIRKARKA